MTIQLELPPELESKIQRHAQIAGIDVDRFVLALVHAGLQFTDTMEKAAEEEDEAIPPEERAARFRDWAQEASQAVGIVDDSRESIYEDRG